MGLHESPPAILSAEIQVAPSQQATIDPNSHPDGPASPPPSSALSPPPSTPTGLTTRKCCWSAAHLFNTDRRASVQVVPILQML